MRPGTHARTPSVADVVRRAVAICDPDGTDDLVTDFMLAYADLLRLCARAEFGDNPPEDVALWLADAGVTV